MLIVGQTQVVTPLVTHPAGILAILLAVLALIFRWHDHPAGRRFFKVVPVVVFCYFVPTALSTAKVIPIESSLYDWIKAFVLPASLVLLTLSLDVGGIIRLGPRAGIMLLAGTAGIVVGGPLAYGIWKPFLPDEAWRTIAYLAGSWIGGSANAVAMQRACDVSDAAISPIIIVDVAIVNLWTGALLLLAARHERMDCRLKADSSAIRLLEIEMRAFQNRVARPASQNDLMYVVAIGFGAAWAGHALAAAMMRLSVFVAIEAYLNAFAWKVIIATTIGVVLSFTRMRALEGAGASKIGTLMLYLLVACIGAGADFRRLGEAGVFLGFGATWIAIHVVIILAVGRLIRAPFFFIAVGSQANIGGAASASIVAGAFNPVLAPVGVLLAIAGYVLGTYAGLLCVSLCRFVDGL